VRDLRVALGARRDRTDMLDRRAGFEQASSIDRRRRTANAYVLKVTVS